jgi:UDP-N-acetylbacillosamine N-acetyltransferase
MSNLVIFGCGGHSRSVADIFLADNPDATLIFVDPNAGLGEKRYGFPVLKEITLSNMSYFYAIGDNRDRKKKFEEIGEGNLVSVISVKAHVSPESTVESGCFIGNFCHIGPEAEVGKNTIINSGAIIEHETRIGRHSHICPNATVAGRSNIADLVFVGTGATIGNSVTICSDVIIGAGATVIKDIKEPGTYVGSPARKIK